MLSRASSAVSNLCASARAQQWRAMAAGGGAEWAPGAGGAVEFEELRGELQVGGVYGE